MESRPDGTAGSGRGRRTGRRPFVHLAGRLAIAAVAVIAAVAIPLAVHAGSEDDVEPTSAAAAENTPAAEASSPTEEPPATGVTDGGDAIRFERFPLDQGWAETYGRSFIDGPSSGAGGISMPEGHCHEDLLFASGYEDKLSTHVSTNRASRTREILGYASVDAARSTFRELRDAVASCAVFDDAYSDAVAYSAEVYGAIDEANSQAGATTFTFGYTASKESHPFGVLYQFALADGVLFGSNVYGDWTARTASEGVAALSEENAALIPLLSRIER
ncbi:hypothetical protein [Nocardioides solisilvae]|uniref:hypothetical protein n=1 Tax=Nocardioides solisilvae TaxID=1542435 RepID=UPI0013A5483B|nr:hypothetical protein [Nocardioides solisilvae]